MPIIHDLKILPEFYKAVADGRKNFEIRKNDRDFQEGEYLELREWTGESYTGRSVIRKIKYILHDCTEESSFTMGLMDGYCIIGLEYPFGRTNYDRIKAMSETELAELLLKAENIPYCFDDGTCRRGNGRTCNGCMKNWLRMSEKPGNYFSVEWAVE